MITRTWRFFQSYLWGCGSGLGFPFIFKGHDVTFFGIGTRLVICRNCEATSITRISQPTNLCLLQLLSILNGFLITAHRLVPRVLQYSVPTNLVINRVVQVLLNVIVAGIRLEVIIKVVVFVCLLIFRHPHLFSLLFLFAWVYQTIIWLFLLILFDLTLILAHLLTLILLSPTSRLPLDHIQQTTKPTACCLCCRGHWVWQLLLVYGGGRLHEELEVLEEFRLAAFRYVHLLLNSGLDLLLHNLFNILLIQLDLIFVATTSNHRQLIKVNILHLNTRCTIFKWNWPRRNRVSWHIRIGIGIILRRIVNYNDALGRLFCIGF